MEEIFQRHNFVVKMSKLKVINIYGAQDAGNTFLRPGGGHAVRTKRFTKNLRM